MTEKVMKTKIPNSSIPTCGIPWPKCDRKSDEKLKFQIPQFSPLVFLGLNVTEKVMKN